MQTQVTYYVLVNLCAYSLGLVAMHPIVWPFVSFEQCFFDLVLIFSYGPSNFSGIPLVCIN